MVSVHTCTLDCSYASIFSLFFFFFQAEDGIRDVAVTGVQTCALPISGHDVGIAWLGINLGIARHRSRRLSKLTSLWIAPAKLIGLLLTPIIRILCGLALITFTRSGQCTIRGRRN